MTTGKSVMKMHYREHTMLATKRLLVATDYSIHASYAETRAALLAAYLKADTLEMMVMNATKLGLGSEAISSRFITIHPKYLVKIAAINQLSPFLREYANDAQGASHVIKEGDLASAVFARAKETYAELTIFPLKRNNLFTDFIYRNSASDSLKHIERPTLVVRNQPEDNYERILVATDFSESSREAAQAALLMCPSAHFTFLHVCDIQDDLDRRGRSSSDSLIPSYKAQEGEAARRQLNRFIEELRPRTQLIFRSVLYGSARSAILQYARQMQAQLIVVGKRGASLPEMPFDSSLGHYLVNRTNYDLLLADADPSTSFDKRIGA
jgi:nucleotide-binding universal stress UspA family protein